MYIPEPCVVCENILIDFREWKEDGSYMDECKLGLTLGNKDCPERTYGKSQEIIKTIEKEFRR